MERAISSMSSCIRASVCLSIRLTLYQPIAPTALMNGSSTATVSIRLNGRADTQERKAKQKQRMCQHCTQRGGDSAAERRLTVERHLHDSLDPGLLTRRHHS
jgi:hypothetical protein